MGQKVIFEDWGNVPYEEAWERQALVQKALIANKLVYRDLPILESQSILREIQRHHLIFCEHPHVYTLGKSGSDKNLLLSEQALTDRGASFHKINRGGDITYHGPGQIVGYPIFDMDCFFNDVHRYVRFLEEVIIRTLAEYGLEGIRIKEYTGVWLEGEVKRKICAIGVHFSRWVTMHGFAFNIQPDLKYFEYMVPCGIQDPDKAVTSLSKELGRPIGMDEVKGKLKKHFADVFSFDFE